MSKGGVGGGFVLQDNLVSKADLSCKSPFALISDEVLGNVEMSALETPLTVANLHYQLSAINQMNSLKSNTVLLREGKTTFCYYIN